MSSYDDCGYLLPAGIRLEWPHSVALYDASDLRSLFRITNRQRRCLVESSGFPVALDLAIGRRWPVVEVNRWVLSKMKDRDAGVETSEVAK